MEIDKPWESDCESSGREMKSVAYTAISLVAGIISLVVGLVVML